MSASTDDDATLPGDDASLGPGRRESEGWLMPGAPVGRYMVLSRLGAGGMGVVYAAYDPELDRKVALKLLRPGPGSAVESRDREHRMLKQEAQALAKLSHPNVIAVHDVGEHEGRVFLAMEYVDGETLGSWMKREHDWRHALALFLHAGEGLHAAHEQGLVHRDFKPDNVLLGKDGRVRVMDFGLARRAVPTQTQPEGRVEAPGKPLGIVGTPAYMAPEQLMGSCADARSDQFSFCVSLWQALYGQRPFVAQDTVALLDEMRHGHVQTWAHHGAVPGWVRRVVLTGLDPAPDRRHASMDALLQALRRDPSRARRRAAAALTAITLAGAGWGAVAWNEARTIAACEAEGRAIEADWTPEQRTAIERAILSHDVSFAEETWDRVAPRLDAYAEGWRHTCEAACRAQRVEGHWDEALAARASDCLQERRAAFGAAVEVLASVNIEGLLLVQSTLGSLPALEACLDEDGLRRRSPPRAPELRARSLQVRTETARAEVEWRSGREQAGAARLEAALADARALADPELIALVEGELGEQLLGRGEYERGAELLRLAYYGWGRHGEPEAQAGLAAQLARVEAEHLGRLDLAELWLEHAAMLHRRVAGPDAEEPMQLTRARATVKAERGDYDGALVLAQRAQAEAERVLGPDHPGVDMVASTVTDIEIRRGDFGAAQQSATLALARQRRSWGDHHPEIARTLINLAIVESHRGELEAAQGLAEEAVALTEQSLGPSHPRTADALQALASVHSKRGRHEEAIAGYERAIEVYDRNQPARAEDLRAVLGGLLTKHGDHERAVVLLEHLLEAKRARLGRDSPELLNVLINLGAAQRASGDEEAAAASYRDALRVGELSLAPDHPSLAFPLNNLGSIEHAQGRLASARQLLSRALEIRLAKLGDQHPLVASTLDTLAMVDLDEHDVQAATARLQQARKILQDAGADPHRLAQIELHLARAIRASDAVQALTLVQACERTFAELGQEDDRRAAEQLRRELEAGVTSPR